MATFFDMSSFFGRSAMTIRSGLILAAAANLLLPAVASAAVSANAYINLNQFEVIDLSPDDNQAAGFFWTSANEFGVAFNLQSSSTHIGSVSSSETDNRVFSRNDASLGAATVMASSVGGEAAASAQMTSPSNVGMTLALSGFAQPVMPSMGDEGAFFASGSTEFLYLGVLPYTQLRLTGDVSASFLGIGPGSSSGVDWCLRLAPGNIGWSVCEGISVTGLGIDGEYTASHEWEVDLVLTNNDSGYSYQYFGAQVQITGQSNVSAVPWPPSAWLSLLGLTAVLARVRARADAA